MENRKFYPPMITSTHVLQTYLKQNNNLTYMHLTSLYLLWSHNVKYVLQCESDLPKPLLMSLLKMLNLWTLSNYEHLYQS